MVGRRTGVVCILERVHIGHRNLSRVEELARQVSIIVVEIAVSFTPLLSEVIVRISVAIWAIPVIPLLLANLQASAAREHPRSGRGQGASGL
jgi:hypothetical protein